MIIVVGGGGGCVGGGDDCCCCSPSVAATVVVVDVEVFLVVDDFVAAVDEVVEKCLECWLLVVDVDVVDFDDCALDFAVTKRGTYAVHRFAFGSISICNARAALGCVLFRR